MATPRKLSSDIELIVGGEPLGSLQAIEAVPVSDQDPVDYVPTRRFNPDVSISDVSSWTTTFGNAWWACGLRRPAPSRNRTATTDSEEAWAELLLRLRRWGIDQDSPIPRWLLGRVIELALDLGFQLDYDSEGNSIRQRFDMQFGSWDYEI